MLMSLGLRSNVDLFDFLPLVYSTFTLEVSASRTLPSRHVLPFFPSSESSTTNSTMSFGTGSRPVDSHLGGFGANKWI